MRGGGRGERERQELGGTGRGNMPGAKPVIARPGGPKQSGRSCSSPPTPDVPRHPPDCFVASLLALTRKRTLSLRQIVPGRVMAVDQRDLGSPRSTLQLLLTGDRSQWASKPFDMRQAHGSVAPRKVRPGPGAVLGEPPSKIVRNPYVERRIAACSQDVYGEWSLSHRFMASTTLRHDGTGFTRRLSLRGAKRRSNRG